MAFYVESTVAGMISDNFVSTDAHAKGTKDPFNVLK